MDAERFKIKSGNRLKSNDDIIEMLYKYKDEIVKVEEDVES
jgi:hypothetical protein